MMYMKYLSNIAPLYFWIFCLIDFVHCNDWSNHGGCVPGSSIPDANLAISYYYQDASYYLIENRLGISYVLNGRTYKVFVDKNPNFQYTFGNRRNWQACNLNRSPCDVYNSVSGGGACCYEVTSRYGVGLECMKMDVS